MVLWQNCQDNAVAKDLFFQPYAVNHLHGHASASRGRPYMTSDDFCHFLTPPPPLIRCFISTALLIKSDLTEPPYPLPSDVIQFPNINIIPLVERKDVSFILTIFPKNFWNK